jgi:hypothetical protein
MTIGNGPGAAYRVLMPLRVAGAQLNLTVGDISGNEALIGEAMDRATAAGADVLLVPELAISGYPPEDLVLRRDFVSATSPPCFGSPVARETDIGGRFVDCLRSAATPSTPSRGVATLPP